MDDIDSSSDRRPPSGFGLGVNNYLNHYINVADAKAAGVLTADFTIGGYLLIHSPTAFWSSLSHWIAVILLITSAANAIRTLYPRAPKFGGGLIFWEDVRQKTFDEYYSELRLLDDTERERQYAAQNYLVSGVLSAKYSIVRWSMRLLIAAIPFATLRLILG
jgi:hypothetical protein